MDYLKNILDKGVCMSVNLGLHKLNENYLAKLNENEILELNKLYLLCENLTNEYYRLTKENQKIFEKINREFIELLDKQINLPSDASSQECDYIENKMKSLEKKYKKLEVSVGLDLVKNEIYDCIEKINFYFLQVEEFIEKSLPSKNPCY